MKSKHIWYRTGLSGIKLNAKKFSIIVTKCETYNVIYIYYILFYVIYKIKIGAQRDAKE